MSTLQKFRNRAGLSREAVAEIMRVAVRTIYNWEYGVTQPTSRQIANLRILYNLSDDEVLTLIENHAAQKEAL